MIFFLYMPCLSSKKKEDVRVLVAEKNKKRLESRNRLSMLVHYITQRKYSLRQMPQMCNQDPYNRKAGVDGSFVSKYSDRSFVSVVTKC